MLACSECVSRKGGRVGGEEGTCWKKAEMYFGQILTKVAECIFIYQCELKQPVLGVGTNVTIMGLTCLSISCRLTKIVYAEEVQIHTSPGVRLCAVVNEPCAMHDHLDMLFGRDLL